MAVSDPSHTLESAWIDVFADMTSHGVQGIPGVFFKYVIAHSDNRV